VQSIKPKKELSTITGVSKIRILQILNQHGKLVLAHVSRKTGLNYASTIKALESLCSAGFVREERHGTQRIFESTFREFHIQFKTGSGIEMTIK
jgi:predicted transcriptional regulator